MQKTQSPCPQALPQHLAQFQYDFTQPTPSYGLQNETGWHTIHQPLGKTMLAKHLGHDFSIGSFGRWYPHWGILDFDDFDLLRVQEIRSELGMNEDNSILFTSVSPNSYHLYFKPTLRGKEMTLNLYARCFLDTKERFQIEVFPQANNVIRLPFGKGQNWVRGCLICPLDYVAGMAKMAALEAFDVQDQPYFAPFRQLPYHDFEESLSLKNAYEDTLFPTYAAPIHFSSDQHKGWKSQALGLIHGGLQAYGQRLDAQKKVVYFYWSQNIVPEITVQLVQQWIAAKNNGFSRDFSANPNAVFQQIERLTHWMYGHFEKSYTLPDAAHLIDKGYLTPALVQRVLRASAGRLSVLKFGLALFGYLAPRDVGGNKISVHKERLVEWSSTTNYLNYLQLYKQAGLLKRDERYKMGSYAKGITLLDSGKSGLIGAIMLDSDRPAHGVHELMPAVYSPYDYAKELSRMGIEKSTIKKQINEIYGESKPAVIRKKKTTTQETIQEYRAKNPKATQTELANLLGFSLRTIKSYWHYQT
jgi:hypothetical protein